MNNSIVGIGMNINQTTFTDAAPNPISLSLINNALYDVEDMLMQLTNCLLRRYENLEKMLFTEIDQDYLNHLFRLNMLSPYLFQGKEILAGIQSVNSYGQLKLLTKEGETIECAFKEIEFIL